MKQNSIKLLTSFKMFYGRKIELLQLLNITFSLHFFYVFPIILVVNFPKNVQEFRLNMFFKTFKPDYGIYLSFGRIYQRQR